MKSLKDISTLAPENIDKKDAEKATEKFKEDLFDLQNKLYATNTYSLLIVLQGMDAAGKDGTIRHVFSCINPMGCNVKSFKTPTEEERAHDFLWRIHPLAPARGMIQIFNRSHYEDILVPTVEKLFDKEKIEKRYERINNFEENLVYNNTRILKFYLHISPEEQKERLNERINNPAKNWKHNPNDMIVAKKWDEYMKVYERIFKECSPSIPWHIVPADQKWYRNFYIAGKIVETLKSLDMRYPENPIQG